MDADVSFDERHKSGRQRRVGLAPSWQVLRLRFWRRRPFGPDAPRSASDGDTKAGLTGASTI